MIWSRLTAIRSLLLVLAGFALIVIGVGLFSPRIAVIVAGALMLLLAYLTDAGDRS